MGIKAADFRLNNSVISKRQNGFVTEIHSLSPGHVKLWFNPFANYFYDEIEGIPLTEDWLLKMGFEKWYEPNTLGIDAWQKGYEGSRFDLMYENETVYLKNRYASFNKFHQSMPDIKYVHQLQNLYFALTGTELAIK